MWWLELVGLMLQLAFSVIVSVMLLLVMITVLALWRNDMR